MIVYVEYDSYVRLFCAFKREHFDWLCWRVALICALVFVLLRCLFWALVFWYLVYKFGLSVT